jgi:phospholipase/carboxylesterase
MHKKEFITAGQSLETASKVLIMMHGRGGSAEDILGLSDHLQVKDFAIVAPKATHNTWYPYSFLMPPQQNEPWLSSALQVIKEIVNDLVAKGVTRQLIYFLGFSQGACLTLEFVTRNATRFGGVVALTGGLIGDKIYEQNYAGNFDGTKIFIGTSDPDPHVPVQRVHDSELILRKLNAAVTVKVYKGMGHTINQDELDAANIILTSTEKSSRDK